jgi:hypothetical protein
VTRSTWHYDDKLGKLVPGPGPRRVDGSGDGWRFSDRLYSGKPFKAHDGTVIDSKRKHREYMKRHNLTTMDDYSKTWREAEQRREEVFTGKHDREARRAQVARAMEKARG